MGDEQMKLWDDENDSAENDTIGSGSDITPPPQMDFENSKDKINETPEPKRDSVTSVISDQEIVKEPIIVPEKHSEHVYKLWNTMDRFGALELRQVLDTLKKITGKDLTYGKIGKYIKYCSISKNPRRKNRNIYSPDRDKWKLPTPKIPEFDDDFLTDAPSKSRKEIYTFTQAVSEALERKEDREEEN
ncbi:hypothetical protein K0B04_03380 [Patescibacteria group bacterium]|nr:hypothetical protein [Patescibacteria group bacterium]